MFIQVIAFKLSKLFHLSLVISINLGKMKIKQIIHLFNK